MSIYHDNIVLTGDPEAYRFEFTCKLGKNEERRWTLTPSDADVGDRPMAITVKDAGGKVLEQGKTMLHIFSANGFLQAAAPAHHKGKPSKCELYPNEKSPASCSARGNPLTLLGTHKPAGVKPGVAHEGYGGWKWSDLSPNSPPETAGSGRRSRGSQGDQPIISSCGWQNQHLICSATWQRSTAAMSGPMSSPPAWHQ